MSVINKAQEEEEQSSEEELRCTAASAGDACLRDVGRLLLVIQASDEHGATTTMRLLQAGRPP